MRRGAAVWPGRYVRLRSFWRRRNKFPLSSATQSNSQPDSGNEAAAWIESESLSWAVAYCSPAEIDTLNILQASFAAMHRALDALTVRPNRVVVDGHRFVPYSTLPHECVVKGDGKFAHIGAASILAKTYRDRFMQLWHGDYPMYDWNNNKGYPTAKHISAVRTHGITPLHRKSFHVKGKQLKLKL